MIATQNIVFILLGSIAFTLKSKLILVKRSGVSATRMLVAVALNAAWIHGIIARTSSERVSFNKKKNL